MNPSLLGGSRPLPLRGVLDEREWDVRLGLTVTDWSLSSDVVVAARR